MDPERLSQHDNCGPLNNRLILFRRTLNEDGKHVTFIDHDSNIKTIKVLYEWLKEYKQIPDIKKLKKHGETSRELRFEGNKIYGIESKFHEALELFNKALCWADGDVAASRAYARRAGVYFEWKKYEICIENINMALSLEKPSNGHNVFKLKKRKLECINHLNKLRANALPKPVKENKESSDITQASTSNEDLNRDESKGTQTEDKSTQTEYLSYNIAEKRTTAKLTLRPNPEIPFIADCLILNQRSAIIPTVDLKPGEIIAIEEPYVSSLTKHYRYRKCANCFKDSYMNLIPCKKCTCTMFCSKKCLAEAQKTHQFECPIMEYIWDECEELALPLRLVIKAFTTFDSVDQLINFRKESENIELELSNWDNDKKRFKQSSQLLTHEGKRNHLNMFLLCCKAAILYHFLMTKTEFSRIIKTDIHRDTLISVILQQLQIADLSALSCRQIDDLDIRSFMQLNPTNVISNGIYLISSYAGHSCFPNTLQVSFRKKIFTYTTRSIRANAEIKECYRGLHYLHHSKSYRQQQLLSSLYIECDCEACTRDFHPLSPWRDVHTLIYEGLSLLMNTLDLNNDIEQIDTFLKILNQQEGTFPDRDLSLLRLRLHRAVATKYGELSTRLKARLHNQMSNLYEMITLPNRYFHGP